jgi:hypothetical protein
MLQQKVLDGRWNPEGLGGHLGTEGAELEAVEGEELFIHERGEPEAGRPWAGRPVVAY